MTGETAKGTTSARDGPTDEEADNLKRSQHTGKATMEGEEGSSDKDAVGNKNNASYRDSVLGGRRTSFMDRSADTSYMVDGEISDDDLIEECTDGTWFGMGKMRKEKIEAKLPWSNSLIIKLVGRSIGYHYLWRRIQAMGRTLGEPLLIDLGFDFFIVKLARCEEYERALFEGPWMIDDHYLHVLRWRTNSVLRRR